MRDFNRRSFLNTFGTLSASAFLTSLTQPAWSRNLHKTLINAENRSATDLASDEDFWYYIQESFTVSPNIINLNNGG
ncbi:MAG TPA: aminotransferase, partial [Puia sp.]|nr:aminotransferase [Puia sp.]